MDEQKPSARKIIYNDNMKYKSTPKREQKKYTEINNHSSIDKIERKKKAIMHWRGLQNVLKPDWAN